MQTSRYHELLTKLAGRTDRRYEIAYVKLCVLHYARTVSITLYAAAADDDDDDDDAHCVDSNYTLGIDSCCLWREVPHCSGTVGVGWVNEA